MSEQDRARLNGELRQALGEVARLSDRIAALRSAGSSAEVDLRDAELQRAAANAHANALRAQVTALDAAQMTPVPR